MTSFLNSIGKRKKTPDQLVISSKQALQTIVDASNAKEEERVAAMETLGKSLVEIKNILYGSIENPDIDEEKAAEISKYMQSEGLIALLIHNLDSISFEARKDTALIFNNLIRKSVSDFHQHLTDNKAIVERLLQGYLSADSALSCGSMIRETIRNENLARFILNSEHFWAFLDTYVHLPNFDIASDAFNTLRDFLTMPRHKHVAQEFMEQYCDKLLEKYDSMLQSENYVTRRRSLKLLSEILLDRSNYVVMMRYISSKQNLKTIMTLLRHKSPQIQFETFHVFKIFVANPSKPQEIESILSMNKAKLIAYLEAFHIDNEDPQFVDEKRLLIDTLQQMADPPVEPSSRRSGEGHSSPHSSHHRDSHSPTQNHHHHHHHHNGAVGSSRSRDNSNSNPVVTATEGAAATEGVAESVAESAAESAAESVADESAAESAAAAHGTHEGRASTASATTTSEAENVPQERAYHEAGECPVEPDGPSEVKRRSSAEDASAEVNELAQGVQTQAILSAATATIAAETAAASAARGEAPTTAPATVTASGASGISLCTVASAAAASAAAPESSIDTAASAFTTALSTTEDQSAEGCEGCW